jgi:hypothetical protein
MFVPFYSTAFLAFESGNVIGLQVMKMMSGGSGSAESGSEPKEEPFVVIRLGYAQGEIRCTD